MKTTFSIGEKIIFSILLLSYIIPEIIWGGVRNQLYMLYTANFSQYNSSSDMLNDLANRDFIISVLYMQFIAIFLSLLFLILIKRKIGNGGVFWGLIAILGILVVLTLIVCLIAYASTHITVRF